MSRGGIIFQPILFDLGAVAPLSGGVPPPGAGGSGGSGGSGGGLAPILAGLLLFLSALGFSTGPVVPSQQGLSAPVTGPVSAPSGAGAPAQVPGGPAASPPAPSAAPPPPGVPAPPPSQPVPPSPGAAPIQRLAIVSPSAPSGGPSAQGVQKHGPPAISRRGRPVLPFTGASLLTPMAAGMGLIVLGLVLRWMRDPAGRT
jgi:hypothetical protein